MELVKKRLSIILVIALLVSIIPLLVLSFYNVPQQDDYYFGIKTVHAYNETGSFIETLKAAGDQVAETYENWQGSWSAIFLFALHPGIWGAQYYFLSTFILLAVFIGCTALFSHVVLGKVFQMPKYSRIIFTAILLFAQIQFVPTAVQSFFWWNGSVYYTFFYSLALALFSLIAIYLTSKSKVAKVFSVIAACLTAAVISGGNYVTALVTLLILCAVAVYVGYERTNFSRKQLVMMIVVIAVFAVGFAISMLAPGNGVRASRYDLPFNRLIMAAGGTFLLCFHRIYTSANLPFLFALLLLSPFLVSAAEKSSLKFKHPWIFTLFVLALFASQFAPPTFGMGGMDDYGSARIVNIIYFSMYWFMAAEIYYIGGYVTHKYGVSTSKWREAIQQPKTCLKIAAVSAIILIITPAMYTDHWYCGGNLAMTNAVYSLTTGEAQRFSEEWHERIDVLTDPEQQHIEFTPLSAHPRLLYYSDLDGNSDYEWSNLPMRRYYDKEYLVVRWD